MIDTLDEMTGHYDLILCDVWGVVHNGISVFDGGIAALKRARDAGLAVVLVTNAPRPHPAVEQQIRQIGAPADAWDRIVTSGDVTRNLIENGPRRVFHIGADRDLTLYDGLDVELVEEQEADGVVCTGLVDDDTETPEDYAELLQRLRGRDLPFICANPDIVVERGDRLLWCAGALARDYGLLGGRTMIAGKPHRPIYEAALRAGAEILGREVEASRTLAIGDGMFTDVKGAAGMGFDVLYVTAGIHAREYGDGETPDAARLQDFLDQHGHQPVATIPRLK